MRDEDARDLRLSEVIAALSYALDITEGQPLGHAVRSCLIGMRIADELEIGVDDRAALFYGLLLKDAGCSSNAAKMAALYGADDLAAKANVKLVNHSNLREALGYVVRNVGSRRALVRVLSAGPKTARELTQMRCERGAEIARMLDLPPGAAEAIYALDEHWDGKGHPNGLAGEAIPLLARILCLSQTLEVFVRSAGVDGALAMAADRSGTWFDPSLVAAATRIGDDEAFWAGLREGDLHRRVAALEPPDHIVSADDEQLDRVAEAFARVIDAKSPYTFRHSERVAMIAVDIAARLGFDDEALRDLRRAGLLHDLGKLSISSRILDKPGPLTDEELELMRRHPAFSGEILRRVRPLAHLADVAAAHHERLDGLGYPAGLHADDLTPAMRVLAVADVYEALTAERPYRPAMTHDEAMEILRADAGVRLCERSIAVVEAGVGAAEPVAVA